jgi:hypothetical protein
MPPRVFLSLVLWLLSVAGGFGYLAVHAGAPGLAADAPRAWPAATGIARRAGREALVVLLHPECPCSRATVAELARLLARVGDHVDTHVLFVRAPGLPGTPVGSALWQSVAAIPHVELAVDEGGAIARSFGAATSGQVLLYDARGALRFAGGITRGRGHEGDSDGRDALERLIDGAPGGAREAVFGCSLFGETR